MAEIPIIFGRLAFASKGSDERIRRTAETLAKLGFQVCQTSVLGVHFRGPKELFETVFAATIQETNTGWTFAGRPVIPDLLDCPGASVYLPRKPTFFS